MIDELPDEFLLENENFIRSALAAYNALTEEQQALVTNYDKIKGAIYEEEFDVEKSTLVMHLAGKPKIHAYNEMRGNKVSAWIELKEGKKFTNLTEVEFQILKDGVVVNSMRPKSPSIFNGTDQIMGSWYTIATETGSWNMDSTISGEIDDVIFDEIIFRYVDDNVLHVISSTDLDEHHDNK